MLESSEIHVWVCHLDEISEKRLMRTCYPLLNRDEQNRYHRFRFDVDRKRFLTGRALLRTTLSKYTGTPPEQLSFRYNNYGKPEVLERCNDVPLRFSLSRSEGLVVCAVMLENDIGIDIEYTNQPVEAVDIAAHFFSETEKQSLQQLSKASVTREFFRYWTLKESYIKALGVGLSLSLDSFSFDIADLEHIRISFDDKTADIPDSWRFFQRCLAEDYILAISAKVGSKDDVQVKILECPITGNRIGW